MASSSDPNVLTVLRKACKAAGAELVAIDVNPVDEVWTDQPPAPLGPATAYPEEFAGLKSAEKRRLVAEGLRESGADTVVLSAPDSIAWLLNIRGSDVPNTPLALSFAIVHATGSVDWYVDSRKLTTATRSALDDGVTVKDPAQFGAELQALGAAGKSVRLDTASIPEAVRSMLSEEAAEHAFGRRGALHA